MLLSTTLVDALRSEGKGPARSALLQLYRYLAIRTGEPVGRVFVAHAGSLALLEAVLPEDLTLPKLIKVLCAGKGALADLCRLGRRSLTDDARSAVVSQALDAALALLNLAPAVVTPKPESESEEIDDDDEISSDDEDRAESHVESESEDDDDEDEDEDDDEEEYGGTARPPGPEETYLDTLRIALAVTCAGETIADPAERAARLQSIQAFNPLSARIPSIEEERRMNERTQPAGEGRRRALESGGRTAPRITSAGGGRPSARPAAPTSSGGGGSTITVIRGGGASGRSPTSAASTGGTPAGEGSPAPGTPAGETPATGATASEPNAECKLPAPMIARHELDQAVQSVAAGLNQARELDERVWLLFADPELELEDPCAVSWNCHRTGA